MIPKEFLDIIGQVGPLGIFLLILFKLWSEWDIRRKEKKQFADGEHPRDTTRKKIDDIKKAVERIETLGKETQGVVYEAKEASGNCEKESAATRQLITNFLVNKHGD
jgi:hypothetical protein